MTTIFMASRGQGFGLFSWCTIFSMEEQAQKELCLDVSPVESVAKGHHGGGCWLCCDLCL